MINYDLLLATPKPKFKCDFTQISTLPNEISFSRAGNAMQFDATGTLTWAPSNVVTNSTTLNGTGWGGISGGTGTAPVITSGQTDPDGGTAAFRVQTNRGAGTTASDYSLQRMAGSASTTNNIRSIWVKSNTAGSQIFTVAYGNPTTITATTAWQRMYVSVLAGTNAIFDIGVHGGSSSTDASVDILVWQPQSEAVTYQTTPGTYVATTSAAYYGPRFDNTPGVANSPLGLLIEEARTNYVTQFSPFTTGWALTTATIGTLVASPDGTSNASPVTNTAIYGFASTNMTLPVDTSTYCASVFIKKTVGATVFPGISLYVGSAYYSAAVNTNTGTITARTGQVPSSSSITDAGTFWRVAITAPNASVAAASFQLYPAVNADASATWTGGTGTATFYGAQVEKGTFATSPIFTTTAAVTRAADVAQLTGYALTVLQGSAFSIVVQTNGTGTTLNGRIISFGASNNPVLYWSSSTSLGSYNNATTLFATAGTGTFNGNIRSAIGVSNSGRSLVLGGGVVATDTNTFASPAYVSLGNINLNSVFLNGYVEQFSAYNKRLPNLTLKAKTVLGAPL